VVIGRLQRLDDRLGLSPESRWDRRGEPRQLERWAYVHPVQQTLGLAAIALALFAFELAGPGVLTLAAFLIVVTWATRRRWHDWQQLRGGLGQPEGP
jgi:hypothetical protein